MYRHYRYGCVACVSISSLSVVRTHLLQVGPGVRGLRKGDRVVTSFCISCNHCAFCNRGLFTSCANTNPS